MVCRAMLGYDSDQINTKQDDIVKLLRSSELAEALGLTKNKVIELANENQIPAYKLPSGHYRFDLQDVKRALKVGEDNE